MREWAPRRGATLLIPSGTNTDPHRKHLFIICTEVNADGEVLLVSVRSESSDATCQLRRRAHSFLTKDSFVSYEHAVVYAIQHLRQSIEEKIFVKQPDIKDSILREICEGIEHSRHTARKMKLFYSQNKDIV